MVNYEMNNDDATVLPVEFVTYFEALFWSSLRIAENRQQKNDKLCKLSSFEIFTENLQLKEESSNDKLE